MRDISLKLLSLAIAVALALFVRSESNTSLVTFMVPLELRNLSKDLIVMSPHITQAEVTVRGPSFLVSRLYASPPSFKLALPDSVGESFRTTLDAKDLNLPSSLRVIKIDPPEIEFSFDKRVSQMVKVQVKSVGNLGQGLKLESLEVQPEKIEVQGAESEIRGLALVETVPLDLKEIKNSEVRELSVSLPGRHTFASVLKVQVKIGVSVENTQQSFKDIKVTPPSLNGVNAQLSSNTVRLKLSGPVPLLKSLKAEELKASIDFQSGAVREGAFRVKVDLPPEVSVLLVEPHSIRVSFPKKK